MMENSEIFRTSGISKNEGLVAFIIVFMLVMILATVVATTVAIIVRLETESAINALKIVEERYKLVRLDINP